MIKRLVKSRRHKLYVYNLEQNESASITYSPSLCPLWLRILLALHMDDSSSFHQLLENFHSTTKWKADVKYLTLDTQRASILIMRGKQHFNVKESLLDKNSSDKIVEISAWCRKFCPSKILSNICIQKSGKYRTKLLKFRLGVENFVRRKILSDKVYSWIFTFIQLRTNFVNSRYYF